MMKGSVAIGQISKGSVAIGQILEGNVRRFLRAIYWEGSVAIGQIDWKGSVAIGQISEGKCCDWTII